MGMTEEDEEEIERQRQMNREIAGDALEHEKQSVYERGVKALERIAESREGEQPDDMSGKMELVAIQIRGLIRQNDALVDWLDTVDVRTLGVVERESGVEKRLSALDGGGLVAVPDGPTPVYAGRLTHALCGLTSDGCLCGDVNPEYVTSTSGVSCPECIAIKWPDKKPDPLEGLPPKDLPDGYILTRKDGSTARYDTSFPLAQLVGEKPAPLPPEALAVVDAARALTHREWADVFQQQDEGITENDLIKRIREVVIAFDYKFPRKD